ncbi:MAG: glycosyltransferase [Candidatus Acididesulfobacter diazotrophicus]|jgi:trehalose synthase|uniref:Glycosyltransferase n=1 Tax=Candidatus Acididesulfobacter diazotrophicus TaxID=2597226 RepID=A0A519BPD9_9DELT|nr:MAG: glycosyltransferase [Candidatus Acididesulfobacter diazotrophicus]
MNPINDYAEIVGSETIDELKEIASHLEGKIVQNINSTAVGGGVAEILNRMIPLLKQLNVDARWDFIKGGEKFFEITKKIHNSLHGINIDITKEEFNHFDQITKDNLANMTLNGDIIFIHDPQPIGLIRAKKQADFKEKKFIWRCHIDISSANPNTFNFLKKYIELYDASVFSSPLFSKKLKIPQMLIAPSIDPLSDKNKELDKKQIIEVADRFNIDLNKKIITQVSRFDRLKDPLGVIDVYRLVKKYIDCQLILAGGSADDDPESVEVYKEVLEKANGDKDIFILNLPPTSNIEINAIQRMSTVILQKSIKEGFGLTVSESLWKKKPTIASAVGGIPLQITHKYSGLLSRTIEGTALYTKQLLQNSEYANKLGLNGHEHVKNNFLITRHIRDYLLLFIKVQYNKESIIYL